MRAGALLAGVLIALGLMAAPASAGDPPVVGTSAGSIPFGGAEYTYLLHTPASYDPDTPVPLVVVAHGCQTTAEQQMRSSLFNQLAEEEGFVVLYADVDETGASLPGPLNQCWKFWDPLTLGREGSDNSAIAAMTRLVMKERAIEPERVYLIGASAGGLMTSALAATHPDLYAAVAIVESSAYGDFACLGTGTGLPVEVTAQLAHLAMGGHARVVPRFAIGGTADAAFPPACVSKALQQGLRTNNLVLSGTQTAPIGLAPTEVRQGQVPGGHSYEVSTFTDPDGCVVGEQWIVNGLAHSWPGGTTDPDLQYNNDTRAPSVEQASWAFFERHRLSGSVGCTATAPPTTDPPTPPSTAPPPVEPPQAPVAPDTVAPLPEALPATGRAIPLALAALLLAGGLAFRHASVRD